MQEKGFSRSARNFYYIVGDIAHGVAFDSSGSGLYATAYILPLYMPWDGIAYTYGDRLNELRGLHLPVLTKKEDAEDWCAAFCRGVEKKILPIFEKINAPEKLLKQLEKGFTFFHCPPVFLEQIKAYTCFCLGKQEAAAAIQSYEKSLKESSFLTVRVRQELLDKAENLADLLGETEETRRAFLEKTMAQSKNIFS